MTPANGNTTRTPYDPTAICGDTGALDTPADKAGGALGMLANLLRVLLERFLPLWVYPPPGFRAYDVQGAVGTPIVGVTATVLELLIPTGYGTVIRGLSVNLNGPGFLQGSGALVFAVTVDNAPVKGYGALLTELGSVQFPRESFGILANSGQTVRIIVTNIAYGPVGGTNVSGSLVGYHYPKQKGARTQTRTQMG